jgi:hypothetical protein
MLLDLPLSRPFSLASRHPQHAMGYEDVFIEDAVDTTCHAHSVTCELLYAHTNLIQRKSVSEAKVLCFTIDFKMDLFT